MDHRFAIGSQVFLVHRVFVRLAGFRLHCNFRSQQNRGAKAGVNIIIPEGLLQNRERRLAGAVNRSDIAHAPGVTQRNGNASDLVVFRRQQVGATEDKM